MDRFLLAQNPLSKDQTIFIVDTVKSCYYVPDGPDNLKIAQITHKGTTEDEIISSISQAKRWYRSLLEQRKNDHP